MSQLSYPRVIEDVPTPDEWDFYLAEAIEALLMEGMDPFFHTAELEARVQRMIAEGEAPTWEDEDIDDFDFVGAFGWVDDVDFEDDFEIDPALLHAKHVA